MCRPVLSQDFSLLERFTSFRPCGIIGVSRSTAGFLFPSQTADPLLILRDRDRLLEKQGVGILIGDNMGHRSMTYKKRWRELIDYYGARCYYCRKEIATTIDHVVPYSWDMVNDIENLVPACALCNAIAGNKMFEDIEQKRQYILSQRAKRTNMRAICVECLLPFAYRAHSLSMFLCAECYDLEYKTDFSKSTEWAKWLYQLRRAGIPAEAHRVMRARMTKLNHKSRDEKLEVLIDEYSHIIDTDEEFAEMLMIA